METDRREMEMVVTKSYLLKYPKHIFVFGDNLQRIGTGGAAKLRYLKNTYGFITKKFPCNDDGCFFTPREYTQTYTFEINKLIDTIINNPDKIFLISKVGSGLANRFKIFEKIIKPNIKNDLANYDNVKFLW